MIIFDTETTDLSPYNGQIAQLSYVKLNEDREVEFAKNFYFAVEYISDGASAVSGLTVEKLAELSGGKKFSNYAEEIYLDFAKEDIIVAHNLDFDRSFLLEEFKRLDKKTGLFQSSINFCTMEYYTDILKIPRYKGYKYPKLSEVIEYLNIDEESLKSKTSEIFKIDDIGYHDARFDVISVLAICKDIFKLKDEIETVLNNKDTVIRNAVILQRNNFGRYYYNMIFDMQFNNEELEFNEAYNVDLFHIKDNRYFVVGHGCLESSIVDISQEISKQPLMRIINEDEDKEDEYEIIDMFDCPPFIEYPEIAYKVKECRKKIHIPQFYLNRRYVGKEIKDYASLGSVKYDDEEIPF